MKHRMGALAALLLGAAVGGLPAARAGEPLPDKSAKSGTAQAEAKGGKAEPGPGDALRERLAERLSSTTEPIRGRLHVVSKARPAKTAKPAHPVHWSYEGEGGPAHWAELKPEYQLCGSGERQSPIDIRDGIEVDLAPIGFTYQPSGFAVLDNGHTVQVNVGAGNTLEVLGRRYELQQFHFHTPSEELVDGRRFDMVVHLVHKDEVGRLAVVAVLLEKGAGHELVQTVWNNLPLERGLALVAPGAIDPAGLLPEQRGYYTYMGSLTTPPCSEDVLWMVMRQPVQVSEAQLAIFAKLYPMNARPVQPAHGRLIKQSR